MRKLHFGPGNGWKKPDSTWLTIDIDPSRADVVLDFNKVQKLPFDAETIICIYASHIFEHMSIFAAPTILKECFRVLCLGGFLRIVIPNVRESLQQYLIGDKDYRLFQRREQFLKRRFGYKELTIFELLKSDFVSPTGQQGLLGEYALGHQNAWDYESMAMDLTRAGFDKERIKQMDFRRSGTDYFSFEGSGKSEANEFERSLYIEAIK